MRYKRFVIEMKHGGTTIDCEDADFPEWKTDFDMLKEVLLPATKFLCVGGYIIPRANIAYIFRKEEEHARNEEKPVPEVQNPYDTVPFK